MSRIATRPCTPDDAADMHRLDQVCFDAPFSFERTTFDILLERPGAVSLAAVHPKQGVVGFIIVEPFSADATIVSTISARLACVSR